MDNKAYIKWLLKISDNDREKLKELLESELLGRNLMAFMLFEETGDVVFNPDTIDKIIDKITKLE